MLRPREVRGRTRRVEEVSGVEKGHALNVLSQNLNVRNDSLSRYQVIPPAGDARGFALLQGFTQLNELCTGILRR